MFFATGIHASGCVFFFMKEAGGKVLTTRGDQGSLTNADVSERINEIFDREDIYEVITKPPTIVCQLKQNLSDRPVNSEIWLFHEVFFIRTQRFPVKHLDIKSLTFKLEGILIYCSNDWKV